MKKKYFIIGIIVLFPFLLKAQPTFNIYNGTTSECEGILKDSDKGLVNDTYDTNENYTFSICVPTSGEIIMSFATFCTEEQYDYIRFFDGPDTFSTQIGPAYSGTALPPVIKATSGCLTVNFISDANLQCTGWIASWKVKIDDPKAPLMNIVGTVPCESSSFVVKLSEKVPCDSVFPAAFLIYGPQSPNIISAVPSPCINGFTDQITLILDTEIKITGTYTVNFTSTFVDECFKPHVLTSETSFPVTGCPLFVQLIPENNKGKLCPGECTRLYAQVTGGDPLSYKYKWSVAGTASSIDVCLPPLSYSVTVTDNAGSLPAIATYTFELFTPPVIQWLLGDTICQSDPAFNLNVTNPGGKWNAIGIWDGNWNKQPGWYEPWRPWQGYDNIRYTDPNGCSDTVKIIVKPFWIFNDDASCPGAAPFTVSGWSPAGGTWSGNFINAAGVFDPTTPGEYLITYNAPNGCSGSKWIRVADLIMPPDVTICSSKDPYTIPISPWGGNWDPSPGLAQDWSWFEPGKAKLGLNKLVYHINGCTDSMNIYVVPVNASNDFTACTNQQPFILNGSWGPAGGAWKGPGIIDTLTGLFDPSLLNDGQNVNLVYTSNGCSDTRVARIRNTEIRKKQVYEFCPYADSLKLETSILDENPTGGQWTGGGVYYLYVKDKDPKNGFYFDPKNVASGIHPAVYSINGCSDTMWIKVHSLPQIDSVALCSEDNPFKLTADLSIKEWYGTGIINIFAGLFDPGITGAGTFTISMVSQEGCLNSGQISVSDFQAVVLGGLEPFYCYKNQDIPIVFAPVGGLPLVDGVPQTSFNPATAGPGLHTISYNFGIGKCADDKTITVVVGEPLGVDLPFQVDSICKGLSTNISAWGTGGSSFGNYVYTWNNGLGFGQTQFVAPTQTTSYSVLVEDGCSDPAAATLSVFVHPDFVVNQISGPLVCYGESTSSTVTASPAGNYNFEWQTSPKFYGQTYTGNPATFDVLVTNVQTGCEQEISAKLPGYPVIVANFSVSPAGNCVSFLDPELTVLDFSSGVVNGTWDFGDGTSEPYNSGQLLKHSYPDTGIYTIKLLVINQGGCKDSASLTVCVRNASTLYAPNAFTPDGDNLNDKFQFVGLGIESIDWIIFDRYGNEIHRGSGMDEGWDGNVRGSRALPGVYTYVAKYKEQNGKATKQLKGLVTVVY